MTSYKPASKDDLIVEKPQVTVKSVEKPKEDDKQTDEEINARRLRGLL